jgi:hypothetical protein
VNQLVEFFLGPKVRVAYDVSLCLYLLASLLSYATVFVQSLVQYLPLPGTALGECSVIDAEAWTGACERSYLIYLVLFAAIVIPFALKDLKETAVFQTLLTAVRFSAVAIMVGTILVAMWVQPFDVVPDPGESAPYIVADQLTNPWRWDGFAHLFLVSLFAQLCHHSNPGLLSLLHAPRTAARRTFNATFATTTIIYLLVGVSCALYFGTEADPVATLMWTDYSGQVPAGTPKPLWAKILSSVVVYFPPADLVSVFPLCAVTLGDSLSKTVVSMRVKRLGLAATPGTHVASKQLVRNCRLAAVIPPLIAAVFARDVSRIIDAAGIFAFVLVFFAPAALQIASIRRTRITNTPYSGKGSSVTAASVVLIAGAVCLWFAAPILLSGDDDGEIL